MRKKLLLIPAAISMIWSNAFALDLEEALSATYKNNPSLQSSRQVFLAEIESFPEALSNFLPDITAHITSSNVKQKIKSQYAPNTVSQETGPDTSKNITITQELFSGGSSFFRLKAAQAGFWVARSKLYNAEQETLTKATEAYLTLEEVKDKYEITIDSLNFFNKQLYMLQERLKVGESTVTEVSLAESQVANAEAVKARNYAELLGAKASFQTITGIEATNDMAKPKVPTDLPASKEDFDRKILQSNLDLLSAKYSLKQHKDGARAAAGSLLPRANLQIKAERNYYRDEIPTSTSRLNSMAYQTSLAVDIPIYSKGGAAYSTIRKNKKAARSSAFALDHAQNAIKAQSISAWESYIAAKRSLDFVDKYVKHQKLALDGIRQEFEVGAKTMLDVLKTQEEYNKAKIQAVEIRKSYLLSAYRLKSTMGRMLAKDLHLKAKYFNPEKEFKRIKYKIIGF